MCAGYGISHAHYVRVCEYSVSGKFRRLLDSSSSGIGQPAMQVFLFIVDGISGATGVSGLNSVGENKSKMFKK